MKLFRFLKKFFRNRLVNRTMKRITIEYLQNPNVNPADYQTSIRAINMLTANIIHKDRDQFQKQLEEERKSMKWVIPTPE